MSYRGKRGGSSFKGSGNGRKREDRTTFLPQALREELYGPDAPKPKSREEKLAKKLPTKQQQQRPRPVAAPPPSKRSRPASLTPEEEQPIASSSKLSSQTPLSKLLSKTTRPAKKPKLKALNEEESVEEKEIRWLEYQLTKGKGAKKTAEDDDDGLDDLLGDLDRLENDLFGGLGGSEEEDEDGMDLDLDDASDIGDVDLNEDDEMDDDELEDEGGRMELEEDGEDDEDSDESAPNPPSTQQIPSKYIPPSLRGGASTQSSSETDVKLLKLIKGQLNRLGEPNLSGVLASISGLWSTGDFRRNDVATTTTRILLSTISVSTLLLDSFLILHATFITALYRLVGVEFGALFLQELVKTYTMKFESMANELIEDNEESNSRVVGNLLGLIAELYNSQLISCVLVYDLIRFFLASSAADGGISERGVEGLLRLLRTSGAQLRSDDPAALKSVIFEVQEKVSKVDAKSLSSRTKFMLETLTNLKNNRIKDVTGGEVGTEMRTRMKKFLGGLGKTSILQASDPLRVSLDDLLNADEKGKWWLVGAGWKGDPLAERQELKVKNAVVLQPINAKKSSAEQEVENELLDLAKRQGMNTEIRRRIFVIVMGSSDYKSAHSLLLTLPLPSTQSRELVRITLHCLSLSTPYNPYFTLIVSLFLTTPTDPIGHAYTVQYWFWDFWRSEGEDLGDGKPVGKPKGKKKEALKRNNAAKALAWLTAKDAIGLGILKPLDFTSLRRETEEFLQTFFSSLIIASQTGSPLFVLPSRFGVEDLDESEIDRLVMRLTKMPAGSEIAQGIIYFMKERMGPAGEDPVVRAGLLVLEDSLRSAVIGMANADIK